MGGGPDFERRTAQSEARAGPRAGFELGAERGCDGAQRGLTGGGAGRGERVGGAGMAEQRRRLVRLAVLEELRASYGIKVKSGSCLAAAKAPGAAAEVSGVGELRGLRFPGLAEPGGLTRVRGLVLSAGALVPATVPFL